MERKIYPALDLMKFTGAFMVIAIHTFPLGDIHYGTAHFIQQVLCRIAVPFYFTCAGFFYVRSFNRGKRNPFPLYMRRLFILYFGWSLIYFPLDFERVLGYTDGSILRAFLIYFHEALFTGTHYHLWYLPALIFSITLLHGALTRKKLILLTGAALVFSLFGLLNDSYYGLVRAHGGWASFWENYNDLFFTTRNGLCFGLIYTAMGALLGQKKEPVKKIPSLAGLVFSILCFLTEYYLLKKFTEPRDYNMYLSLIPLTWFLFLSLMPLKAELSEEVSRNIRSWGMGIYFSHVLLIELFRRVMGIHSGTVLFVLVSLGSLALVYSISFFRIPLLNKLIR